MGRAPWKHRIPAFRSHAFMPPFFHKPIMRFRYLICLAALLACWPLAGVRAEVLSLTLGITTNCPYGLAG